MNTCKSNNYILCACVLDALKTFAKHICSSYSCLIHNTTVTLSVNVNSFIIPYIVSLQRNMRCNYTKTLQYCQKVLTLKLLLWAQDYCSVPKWQTQNTVTALRVIAKPTTRKTSTVLVASTQPKALEKMFN